MPEADEKLRIGKVVFWLERSCCYDDNNRQPWEVETGMVVSFDEKTAVLNVQSYRGNQLRFVDVDKLHARRPAIPQD